MTIPPYSFVELSFTGALAGQFRETARVSTGPLHGGSWRVTVHEPRPLTVNGNAWVPSYLPLAPAAAGTVGRIVNVDAGLLLRVSWSRHQVHHEALLDYVAGLSFTVHGGDPKVEVLANLDRHQLGATPSDTVVCGATIEAAQQGAMSSWPPTRSKDTGVIAHVAGPVTDNVAIQIPPYARAFRWHAYQVGAAATAISFRQFDWLVAGAQARSLVRATTEAASWPNATGAVPIVGTAQWLRVQNDDAAQDVALWIEFLLDLGG